MAIPTECPRCGHSCLTEKEFLYHIALSCQQCGWSEDYTDPYDSMTEPSWSIEETEPRNTLYPVE